MVEDIARNLAPRRRAWHDHGPGCANRVDWAMAEADSDYIHHVVDELAGFLRRPPRPLQSPDRTKPR